MNFLRKETGSIVLEASIIMPFFMFFLLAMIFVIRMMILDLALHNMVHETTKQIATHAYPLTYVNINDNGITNNIIDAKNIIYSIFPGDAVSSKEQDFVNNIESIASNTIPYKAIALSFSDGRFNEENLDINVTTPFYAILNNDTNKSYFLTMEAKYKTEINLPFYTKEIILHKKATERVWIGSGFNFFKN